MPDAEDAAFSEDTNAAVWKSDIGVSFWKSREGDRARRDPERRVMMAELLPFSADEPFTFQDLGAGTRAAARSVLDHYPAAHAALPPSSPPPMPPRPGSPRPPHR